ncbi:MAG: DUF839 domain-containing protein [Chitinophagales bacterium]
MFNKISWVLILILLNASFFVFSQNNSQTTLTKDFQLLDSDLRADILFIGGYHGVHNANGEFALAKQNHDFTGYIPIDGRSDSGYVIVNHELMISDPILGDGGGMTVFTVSKDPYSGKWSVVDDPKGKFRSVDFSEVGGTLMNCGGFQTPWGTVLTAEETMYDDNYAINKDGTGIRDTSDFTVKIFNGETVNQPIKKFENFDWMVEVDVKNAKAIRKNYNMGRYQHEGGTVLPDGKTVFLTDDTPPGYIFKFVANQSFDLSVGQLYVYKQSEDGLTGEWLKMPMELDAMIHAQETAAKMGATMFNRTEWSVYHNGKIYFTETGRDDTEDFFKQSAALGAKMALHLQELDKSDGNEDNRLFDYYGRILEMDMETGALRVYLAGGPGKNQFFSNPDCLALTYVNGHPIVMINEDLNGYSHGRVPAGYNQKINEIYCLDLSIENPTVDDLHKFAIGPDGCETTGGRFTPDGSSYFVNLQHPKSENTFPFNNSVTVAVRDVDDWIAKTVLGQKLSKADQEMYDFKRNKVLRFNKKKSFTVFSKSGEIVYSGKEKVIDFYNLPTGKYQLLIDDQLRPIVIE